MAEEGKIFQCTVRGCLARGAPGPRPSPHPSLPTCRANWKSGIAPHTTHGSPSDSPDVPLVPRRLQVVDFLDRYTVGETIGMGGACGARAGENQPSPEKMLCLAFV